MRPPPQSNYPPQRVPAPDNGARLDIRKQQGGISPMAPRQLAPTLQSLPPMLHSSFLMPLCSCSKGARGDRKSTRLNASHYCPSRMPPSAWNKKDHKSLTHTP